MSTLLIEDLPAEIMARLQIRAREEGVSLNVLAQKALIREATRQARSEMDERATHSKPPLSREEALALMDEIRSRSKFSNVSSVDLIRSVRDENDDSH
jgi:hypothetical protein